MCCNKSTSPNSIDALVNCLGVFFCAKDLMMTTIVEEGLVGQDPAREVEVVRQAAEVARDMGLNPEIIEDVFWWLISLSQWAGSSDTKNEA